MTASDRRRIGRRVRLTWPELPGNIRSAVVQDRRQWAGSIEDTTKEDIMSDAAVKTAARNAAIWHANRHLGFGTARLATQHGLSRQRIKQIVAREDQKRHLALSVLAPEARLPT